MPTFVKCLGRILCAGDSITEGYYGFTGGWRRKLFVDLAAAGYKFVAVGPLTTNSSGMAQPNHYGIGGISTQGQVSVTPGVAQTARPTTIIYAYGMNDLGSGRTAAQYLADLQSLVTATKAVVTARHFVHELILPTADYAPYYANIAAFNTAATDLPAVVTALGATLITWSAQPILSDGVHPIDGGTGYDSMADDTYDAIAT